MTLFHLISRLARRRYCACSSVAARPSRSRKSFSSARKRCAITSATCCERLACTPGSKPWRQPATWSSFHDFGRRVMSFRRRAVVNQACVPVRWSDEPASLHDVDAALEMESNREESLSCHPPFNNRQQLVELADPLWCVDDDEGPVEPVLDPTTPVRLQLREEVRRVRHRRQLERSGSRRKTTRRHDGSGWLRSPVWRASSSAVRMSLQSRLRRVLFGSRSSSATCVSNLVMAPSRDTSARRSRRRTNSSSASITLR